MHGLNGVRRSMRLIAGFMTMGLFSCSTENAPDGGHRQWVRKDSAGITITENHSRSIQGPATVWIDSVPELVLGSLQEFDTVAHGARARSALEIPLEHVQEVRVLSDGRIAVADNGPAAVMIFDTTGIPVALFGRRGTGPGEFRQIRDLHVCVNDSLVVVEPFRMSVFDDEGRFVRQAQFRIGGGPIAIRAVSGDCRRVLTQQRTGMPPQGEWGLTEDVFAWVDPVMETVDTVIAARLLEGWTRELYGVVRPFVIPWGTSGATYSILGGGDRFITGYGRIPEFRIYDSAGSLRSITRWTPVVKPIARPDRRRYAALRSEWLAGMPVDPETEFLFPSLDEYPGLPENKPLFDRIIVDDERRVWVRGLPDGSFGLFDLRLRERVDAAGMDRLRFDGDLVGGSDPAGSLRSPVRGEGAGIRRCVGFAGCRDSSSAEDPRPEPGMTRRCV